MGTAGRVYANAHPFNLWTDYAPIGMAYFMQGYTNKALEYYLKAQESEKKRVEKIKVTMMLCRMSEDVS